MGGRGASSGAGGMSAVLRATLGKRTKPKDGTLENIRDVCKQVNPNFGKNGKSYTHNCQRCVYGYEESRRGYSVEALSYQGKGDDMFAGGRWMKMYEGQRWERNLGNRTAKVAQAIKEKMTNWGEGSRAVVYVAWKGGSAHVFNVEQTAEGTIGIDAQTGKAGHTLLDRYISDAKPSSVMISRVDNLKEKDDMSYALKRKGT